MMRKLSCLCLANPLCTRYCYFLTKIWSKKCLMQMDHCKFISTYYIICQNLWIAVYYKCYIVIFLHSATVYNKHDVNEVVVLADICTTLLMKEIPSNVSLTFKFLTHPFCNISYLQVHLNNIFPYKLPMLLKAIN